MKAFYENSFTMLRVVLDYLLGNITLWTVSVPFKSAVDKLKDVIAEIQALLQIVEFDRLGLAKAKTQKKNMMVEKFLYLRNAVIPYANSINDLVLNSFFNVSESEMKDYRDTLVVEKMRGFHAKALTIILELTPFGIDAAWLAAFLVFIDNYDGYISKPRLGIAERKTANGLLIVKIKEAKKILKGELDYMVDNYQSTEPVFVDGYKNARIIVDIAGGRSEVVEDRLAIGEKKVVFSDLEGEDKLKFENLGTGTLHFCRMKEEGGVFDSGVKVEKGQTVSKRADELAAEGDYLMVWNVDTVNDGKFKVSRD